MSDTLERFRDVERVDWHDGISGHEYVDDEHFTALLAVAEEQQQRIGDLDYAENSWHQFADQQKARAEAAEAKLAAMEEVVRAARNYVAIQTSSSATDHVKALEALISALGFAEKREDGR